MFRRYFQTGDEEDQEGSSGDEEGEQAEQVPPPEEVWATVSLGPVYPIGWKLLQPGCLILEISCVKVGFGCGEV